MRWNQDVGDDGALDEFRLLLWNSRIDVAANVRIGPAVESTFFDGRRILGRQIVAEVVTLVHRSPYSVGSRLQGESHRIPQTRSEDTEARSIRIVFLDHRAFFVTGPLFFDVVRRTNRDIKLLAIPAEENVACGVIAESCQIRQLLRSARCLGIARGVLVADETVRIADVQIA